MHLSKASKPVGEEEHLEDSMHIRFYYFDFPFWRAEPSRLALHLGGIPFDDVRLSRDAFRDLKAAGELPYGQVPMIEVDGARISQSLGILRFCGRLAGMYPDDALEALSVDETLQAVDQISGLFSPSMRERDAAKRQAMRHELATVELPLWLDRLQERMQGNDRFTSNELSIADLVVWRFLGWISGGILDGIPTTILDSHPKLTALYERVSAIPDVRDWMEKHYGT